jgi:hypothetical protein
MDDYENASERHLHDAELLFVQAPQRLANASHLFGISAECSLKAIARSFNPHATFSGRNGHIPRLFFELQNVSSAIGANEGLVSQIAALEPQFIHWDVGQRYASQANFLPEQVAIERAGANDTYLLMTNCLQGLV